MINLFKLCSLVTFGAPFHNFNTFEEVCELFDVIDKVAVLKVNDELNWQVFEDVCFVPLAISIHIKEQIILRGQLFVLLEMINYTAMPVIGN